MSAQEIYDRIKQEGVIVIVRGIDSEVIVDIAQALFEGGIKLFEVTCNTDGAFEIIKKLSSEVGEQMLIGAGTVLSIDDCKQALKAGAQYIVSPDVNPELIDFCMKKDVAVIPGALTATEVLTAKRLGAKIVKIFPAATLGVDYIKSLRGPIDDIDFIAIGGVRLEKARDFIRAGCTGIGIGGAVIKKEWVMIRDWHSMTRAARYYSEEVRREKQSELKK